MKNLHVSKVFLGVYTAISIATLYHSSFGFGTLDGLPDNLSGLNLFRWWFLGFLCATSVDVGMGAIVWSMMRGYKSKYLSISLVILAIFSAYSQLIYSAYFAEDMLAKTENSELRPFMQSILNIRIIILPLCLPFFSLFYGFVAKDSSNKILKDEKEEFKPQNIIEIDSMVKNSVIHYKKNGEFGTVCGLNSHKNSTGNVEDVTCKNCKRRLGNLIKQ